MEGKKLTIEQKEAIQGVFFNDNTFFNCVDDINGDWFLFLSNDDMSILNNTEFDYLLSITDSEYVAKPVENPFGE
jgi:hypothetical protein